MGRLADKVGTRWTVICGALMIGLGLAISTLGPPWPLWVGHGLFIGLIGLGGINAPMYIYVSRWFDRRRGSALALISSGSYLAGAMWPPLFERVIADFGWRQTMLWYGVLEIAVIIPLAVTYFSAPPEVIHPPAPTDGAGAKVRVLGWPPNAVFAVMPTLCALNGGVYGGATDMLHELQSRNSRRFFEEFFIAQSSESEVFPPWGLFLTAMKVQHVR